MNLFVGLGSGGTRGVTLQTTMSSHSLRNLRHRVGRLPESQTGRNASRSQPRNRVTSVSGTPTFEYSTKPISTRPARAVSTTIRLATDPRIVRLPASVEAMARTSQARRGSVNEPINGFTRRTAGTLETRFESTAVTAVRTAGRWRFAA